MDKKIIYGKLHPIIKTYLPEDVDATAINTDSDLTRELNINSAYLVDIILDIEDAFAIEFNNSDMENLRTINDTITIIQLKISEKGE